MVSLFNSIPRDADHTAELWTTVDKNKDNVRSKAVYRLLPGFSLYLTLMAKNFTFETKSESRWVFFRIQCLACYEQLTLVAMRRYRDLLIACNVQASSGPTDTEGLYYMLDKPSASSTNDPAMLKNVKKMMEKFENGMDADLFRSGVMRNSTGSKCKSKVFDTHVKLLRVAGSDVVWIIRDLAPLPRTRSCGLPFCTMYIPWQGHVSASRTSLACTTCASTMQSQK